MPEPDDDATVSAATTPKKKRETPWSVLIVAGIFFAIGMWLYLDVRREVKEMEERKARAPAVQSAKPKILGLDVIPQLSESNEAKVPSAPASVATPSVSASTSGAASSAGPASLSAAPLPPVPAAK